MSSDDQFTSLGPAAVGFQTDGTNITLGVDVVGTELGVRAAGPTGVFGKGESFGVRAEAGPAAGGIGVFGTGGDKGVQGDGANIGVHGRGTLCGVKGEVTDRKQPANRAVGVWARGGGTPKHEQLGILAEGGGGRAGRFRAGSHMAQIVLEPERVEHPRAQRAANPTEFLPFEGLPLRGEVGDFYFTKDADGLGALWLCVRTQEGNTAATWAQVLLGTPMPGTALAD